MSRARRGWILITLGNVAIAAGVLIPPAPWVLLWAPGILLVAAGYGYISGPERPVRRPAPLHAPYPSRIYVNDPYALLGYPPRVPVLVDIRGESYIAVAYGPDWIDVAYPDQVTTPGKKD